MSPYSRSRARPLPSRFPALALAVAIVSATLHAGPSTQAVWVYPDANPGPNLLTDPSARALLVTSTAASNVTDLYVSVYQSTANTSGRLMYPDADLSAMISQAHASHMKVWASYGDSTWPAEGCSSSAFPQQRMAEVAAYNAANPSAPFDGVVLDIEPTDPQTIAQYQALLAVYQCIAAGLAAHGIPTAVAIRFDWTQSVPFPATGPTKAVYEHVIDLGLAKVIVMGYRNTAGTNCAGASPNGLICLDQNQIAYAGSLSDNGLVLVGVNTSNCVPGCGPSEVTFYASPNGQADLNQQAALTAAYFASSPGFGGFAIYDYQNSYLNGSLALWPGTDTGFPRSAPEATSAAPASGAGAVQTFTLIWSDSGGWQNLAVSDVLIASALDGRHACYVAFVASGPSSGSVYLVDDAGDAGGPYSGMTLPSTSLVSNSQCSITGAGSSVSAGGNALTLTLAISFAPAFAGNKVLYLSAQDAASNTSGWQALGTWNVPGSAPAGPSVTGMSPGHSASLTGTYTFTFTDTNGWQDISVANILVNTAIDGRQACYIAFVPATASVLLIDDAGDAAGPYSGMVLPGSATVSNSQCTISGAGSSVSAGGNTLTLILAITFTPTFAGNQLFFLAARNSSGQNSGWQALGTDAIP